MGWQVLDNFHKEIAENFPVKKNLIERTWLSGEKTRNTFDNIGLFCPPEFSIHVPMDGKRIIQAGKNILSVNVLQPYPGWPTFSDLITRMHNLYQKTAQRNGIMSVGLRI